MLTILLKSTAPTKLCYESGKQSVASPAMAKGNKTNKKENLQNEK